jgi:2',3'-cyclic-nucleotide 2'-phosphodiesterase (5'-nucleotidase family)
VGIIGLTAPLDPYRTFKIDVKPPEEVMPELIQRVKNAGADLIMVLSHLGLKNDIALAEKVDGIPLIIGGHSHDRIKTPLKIRDTLIIMAGELGEILGRLDLEIETEGFGITRYFETHPAITDDIPEYPPALAVIDEEKQRAQRIMQIEIGRLAGDCEYQEGVECRVGNLLADALLEHFPEADGAFALGSHWGEGLPAGVITKGQLFSANRSTGNPGMITLSGAQLKQFFMAALRRDNINRTTPVLRGRAPGFPHVAGFHVRAVGQQAERVEILLGDRVVGDGDNLVVVTSDFELSSYLNYLPVPEEQVEYDIPTILPEVVEAYLRRHNPLGVVSLGRITQE